MHNRTPYQIPISEFEKKLPLENKKEILELFTNHNEIKSEDEFDNIKRLMQQACHRGDLELLEIYLNELIELDTESGFLSFKINKSNKTASLFQLFERKDKIIVPRTIEYEGNVYLVTSIISSSHGGKQIECIEFPSNSAVQTIYEESFSFSSIEVISFPSSLIELKDGWCKNTKHLKKIIVSESNNRFLFYENKYLLGKSDVKNEEFDILLFASRDIEEAKIPSNIKIISSFAFDLCKQLSKVEFSTNSNLQTIRKYAFSKTKITEISIPSSVSTICENAFINCSQLTKIEIKPNSNLKTIGKDAFSDTKIEQIYFPSNLIELKDGWCSYTKHLKKIIVSESNNRFVFYENKYLLGKSDVKNEEFDILLFASREIEEAIIPSNIKIISSFAFGHYRKLSKVEFSTNSNLQTIGKYAFSETKITEISIPSSVSTICESAFNNSIFLSKVEFAPNSNLQTIGKSSFIFTKIAQICIPSSVSTIDDKAFMFCEKLSKVVFALNSNLQTIGKYAFSETSITQICIPSSVLTIDDSAFMYCNKLSKVIFEPNSNLKMIGRIAFYSTKITQIYIPSNVSQICERAFENCKNLQICEISEESKLRSLNQNIFRCSEQVIIMIPQKIRKMINLISCDDY